MLKMLTMFSAFADENAAYGDVTRSSHMGEYSRLVLEYPPFGSTQWQVEYEAGMLVI